MSIPLNMEAQNKTIAENIYSKNNQRLKDMCFQDFYENKHFGFGSKRISVDIEGTITEKYPFRAFGYRDEKLILHVGMRKYYDQGSGFKIVEFDSTKTITHHIITLIQEFEKEEKNKENSLNVQTLY